jgi:phosphonate transport system substrate-binding protein
LAQYLEKKLTIPTNFVAGIPWQERERLFDQGAIQVLWLCGLPYVRKAQSSDFGIELLAVPIPVGSRYRAQPIYFSDVVVKRSSRFELFMISTVLLGPTTSHFRIPVSMSFGPI